MEAKRVVREMNKPRVMPVLGIPPSVAVLSLGVSIALGALYSWLAAVAVFAAVIVCGRETNKRDPRFVALLWTSTRLGTEYDPALFEDLNDFPSTD